MPEESDLAHHIQAKPTDLDPNHRADTATKRMVWDLMQGRVKADQLEAPLPTGHQSVEVPMEYVSAIAFHALRELKRQGCDSSFSVKRDPEAPQVDITWQRPRSILLPAGIAMAYTQHTDCLAAFVRGLAPEHVGRAAADSFLVRLAEVEGR